MFNSDPMTVFSIDLPLTSSAARIVDWVARQPQQSTDDVARHLVMACVQEESLAASILRSAGIDVDALPRTKCIENEQTATPIAATMPDNASPALLAVVSAAQSLATRDLEQQGISSEHLVAAVFAIDSPMRTELLQHGLSSDDFSPPPEKFFSDTPLSVPFDLEDDPPSVIAVQPPSIAGASTGRVLDACLNRAREGLRVLEDCARFVLDNETLVSELKQLRHRLAFAERLLSNSSVVVSEARDVEGDVGTQLTAPGETRRKTISDIVEANARRVQESLRSLEEFGKLVSVEFAAEMKQLRYCSYEAHQKMKLADVVGTDTRRARLQAARLCVLISESGCRLPWRDVVYACIDGGVDIIQLREKSLSGQELQDRAGWTSETCRNAGTLFIVNDRCDLAVAADADGVHLGQDDVSVVAAREIIGSERLIGLSTHQPTDLTGVNADAADYFGAGPVFSSVTKEFQTIPGLDYIRQIHTDRPWFAIGGINERRVDDVLQVGAERIAVASAVTAADDPGAAVTGLQKRLVSQTGNL